jgi:hypothetical protein
MKTYMSNSNKPVHWICVKIPHHKWETRVSKRNGKGQNCPFCANVRVCEVDGCNSVYFSHPHLREEWNDERDMKLFMGGNKKADIQWKCKVVPHHVWKACISNKVFLNYGCPICSNKLICPQDGCNSVYVVHPQFIEEYDGDPDDLKQLFPHSPKTLNWKCLVDPTHRWSVDLDSRVTFESGCPN